MTPAQPHELVGTHWRNKRSRNLFEIVYLFERHHFVIVMLVGKNKRGKSIKTEAHIEYFFTHYEKVL